MDTIINISVIPSAQPDAYADKVVSTRPPIFQGVQETALVTDKPLRFKDDPQYLVRPIQTQFFKKYKIQFITNSYYLELIKYSSKVVIQQENEADQRGFVTDVTREQKYDNIYLVEVSYYDLDSEMVAEYLKSSFLFETDIDMELYTMQFGAFNLYTRINPLSIFPEPEQTTYQNQDVNIQTKAVIRKTDTYTFYVSQEDLVSLQNVMYSNLPSTSSQTAKEIVKPSISELSGRDIFKIEIPFVYQITSIYA